MEYYLTISIKYKISTKELFVSDIVFGCKPLLSTPLTCKKQFCSEIDMVCIFLLSVNNSILTCFILKEFILFSCYNEDNHMYYKTL